MTEEGVGFEFTPEGFRPLVQSQQQPTLGVMKQAPAVVPAAQFVESLREQASKQEARRTPTANTPLSRPGQESEPPNPIKLLRERKRWLIGEVKRLRAFERELIQINKMLGGKALAAIRTITSARRSTG